MSSREKDHLQFVDKNTPKSPKNKHFLPPDTRVRG